MIAPSTRLRRGARVRIERHRNRRLVGLTGRVVELESPSGLVPGHPGGAWVALDGHVKEAWCSRDWLARSGGGA